MIRSRYRAATLLRDAESASSTRRRELLAWAVAAAAISLARHIPFASDVFDLDLEGQVGSIFEGLIQRTYLRAGFAEIGGRPIQIAVPTDPVSGVVYCHHPPLVHWVTWPFVAAFGLREWVLRTPGMAMAAASAALLAVFARRHLGRLGAVAAIVVWSTMPMEFLYGRMTNYEAPVILLGLLGIPWLPSQRGGGYGPAAAIVLLATAFDWGGVFLVPGFLVHEWVATGRRPRVVDASLLAAGAIASVAAYVALLAVWSGSLSAAVTKLVGAASYSTSMRPGYRITEGIGVIASHIVPMLTWPGLIATIAGCAAAASGRFAPPVRASIACWGLMAIVNVCAFPDRAIVHDYWWLYAGPLTTIAVAALADAASRAPWRGGRIAAVGLVAIVAAAGIAQSHVRYRETDRPSLDLMARAIPTVTDEDTLLLGAMPFAPLPDITLFYFRAWVVPSAAPAQEIGPYLERFRRGELTVHKLGVLASRIPHPNLRSLTPIEMERLREMGLVEREHALSSRIQVLETSR